MRTVIFVGLLTIAGAINQRELDKIVINWLAIILTIAIFMDIVDFISSKYKK